jgi:hypothetical protein
LATVEFPEATGIGTNAFQGCTSLINVTFPKVSSVGAAAFLSCTNLDRATFPLALTVGNGVFEGCSKLARVDLPSVTSIGGGVFVNAGVQFQDTYASSLPAFRVILGKSAPNLGVSLFGATASHTGARHVRVEVPNDASINDYLGGPDGDSTLSGTDTQIVWGNGFRGRGWNGSSVIQSLYNSNVTLHLSYYWD